MNAMAADYLHNHPQFPDLIRIVADEKGIVPALVEKDYWIMHCLYGLQRHGFEFELKGGTSLSKGHGIIQRFSENIAIGMLGAAATADFSPISLASTTITSTLACTSSAATADGVRSCSSIHRIKETRLSPSTKPCARSSAKNAS